MDLFNTRTVLLNTGKAEIKRAEIAAYFEKTWELDTRLYDHLTLDEAFYLRAEPLRHPLIFYLGHTAAFYMNKLSVARLIDQRINPGFESMFAIGVDEMSWDDLDERNYDWPTVDAVREYRSQVKAFVLQQIQTLPLTLPIGWEDPFWVIMMGIEHQRIHIETSSVIIRRMELEYLRTLSEWQICTLRGEAPDNQLLPVSGGRVQLGKQRNHPLYGWDNEYGTQQTDVETFRAAKFLVSNGEYLPFVEDGGYKQQDWWTEEGRQWLSFSHARHPLFWIPDGESYRLRLLAQEIEMAWNWPVEVNWLEAKAFCNWLAAKSGKPIRLPSEEEWYRLHELHDIVDQPYWEKANGNINVE